MPSPEELAFDAAPIGIALTENRVIRTCNATFCLLTGFERNALINQSFRKLYESKAEYQRVRNVGLKDLTAGRDYSDRCCQTNANQSLVWQGCCPLCRAETAPLSERGGAVGFEVISLGKTALLVEMVEDGGMDGGELL